jgi:hypothetical protein
MYCCKVKAPFKAPKGYSTHTFPPSMINVVPEVAILKSLAESPNSDHFEA